MKNKNRNKIIIIIVLVIILLTIIGYTNFPIFINGKRIKKYIKDNNYELAEYYIYTLTTEENNTTIIKKLLYDNYYFTKCIITTDDVETTKINYYYTKDKEIIIEYEHSSTINNEFKMESIKTKYKDDSIVECESIIGDLSCDNFINDARNYENEILSIINTYKIDIDILDKVKIN